MLYGKIKDSCSNTHPLQVTREEIAAFETQTEYFILGQRMVRAGIWIIINEGEGYGSKAHA
jgi:hypothetical protein